MITITKNQAGTAWIVSDGIIPGNANALNILTMTHTRRQAVQWVEANITAPTGKPFGRIKANPDSHGCFKASAFDERGLCFVLHNKLPSKEAARKWLRETLDAYRAKIATT